MNTPVTNDQHSGDAKVSVYFQKPEDNIIPPNLKHIIHPQDTETQRVRYRPILHASVPYNGNKLVFKLYMDKFFRVPADAKELAQGLTCFLEQPRSKTKAVNICIRGGEKGKAIQRIKRKDVVLFEYELLSSQGEPIQIDPVDFDDIFKANAADANTVAIPMAIEDTEVEQVTINV